MTVYDARRAVRAQWEYGPYLLTRVHRGLQGAAGLLAGIVGGRWLGLRSHDRDPSTVGRVRRHPAVGSSGVSRCRSGVTERVAGDTSRVGGPGWLEVPRRANPLVPG